MSAEKNNLNDNNNTRENSLVINMDKKTLFFLLMAIVFVFLLDRISKQVALLWLESGQTLPVFPGFFHFTLIKNPGAAFGIFPHRTSFFVLLTIFAVLLLLSAAVYLPAGYKISKISLGLMIGGALGNFYDRLKAGYVIDFLDFRIWPVFNLADVAIVIGLVFFLFNIWHAEE